MLRRLLKVGVISLACFLLIFVLAWGLISLPVIQQKVLNALTGFVEKKTQTRVFIEKVDIDFFSSLNLSHVYLEDQEQDTLVYAGKIGLDMNMLNLFRKRIFLDEIELREAVIHLKQRDSSYNFQFFVDAFSSPNTVDTDTAATAWQFGLGGLALHTVDLTLEHSDFSQATRLGEASLTLDKLDLDNQIIQLDELDIKQSAFFYTVYKASLPDTAKVESVNFPDLGWEVQMGKIKLEELSIAYEDQTRPAKEGKGIDVNHMGLDHINLQVRQLALSDSLIKANIEGAAFEEKSGFVLKNLAINLAWSPHELNLEGLILETGASHLVNESRLAYSSMDELMNLGKGLKIESSFSDTQIEIQELETFVPVLGQYIDTRSGTYVEVEGNLTGTPAKLTGSNWRIRHKDQLTLAANFEVSQLMKPDSMKLTLKLDSLNASFPKLNQILKSPLPASLLTLGNVRFQTSYQGGIRGGDLHGGLRSQIGALNWKGSILFRKDYATANYIASLNLSDFDLGALAQNDSLGTFSLEAKLAGSGLSLDSIVTDLDAKITEANLLGYSYQDATIQGKINKRAFLGRFNIQDENLKLDFDGELNLNDSIPKFQFLARLDTLNLDKLNLATEPLGMRAKFKSNLLGNSADKMVGTTHITALRLNSSGVTYSEDIISLTLESTPTTGQMLSLHSDMITMGLSGNYQLLALPELLSNFAKDYFPFAYLSRQENIADSQLLAPVSVLPDQNFQLWVKVKNPYSLSRLFLPELTRLDSLSLELVFDSQKDSIEGQVFIPNLTYADIHADNIQFDLKKQDKAVLADLSSTNFRMTSLPGMQEIYAKLEMGNHELLADLSINNDSIQRLFAIQAGAKAENGKLLLEMKPGFYLDGKEWRVNTQNEIWLHENEIDVRNLTLQKGNQKLDISGNTLDSLTVRLTQFELAPISNLLAIEDYRLSGRIDGIGQLMHLDNRQEPYYTAEINMSSIALNEEPIGDLFISALTNKERNKVKIDARMKGNSELDVSGTYDIAETNLLAEANIQSFQLALVQPFVAESLSQLAGILEGNLSVSGKPEAPQMVGNIGFKNAAARINYLNTYYKIPNETLTIQPNKISFSNFTCRDTTGREAFLTGEVSHRNFEDIRYNFTFNSDEFLFLNTQAGDNQLFFGKMLLEVRSKITGTPQNVNLSGKAKTLTGTNLTVFTLDDAEIIAQEDYILFVSPEEFEQAYEKDSIRTQQKNYQANIEGVSLDMNLEITQEAQLTYVVDTLTGEKIQVRGEADLSLGFNPNGDISLRGNYIVKNGNYHFSYESLITKDFQVRPGSSIVFSGNPLEAILDITASYTARTTTYELISNELGDPESRLAKDAKLRTDVNILLYINGELFRPAISFDIQVPNDKSGVGTDVSNALERKLTQIRQDESELNQQVLGLLVFGSFIEKNSSFSGGVSLENIAVSNVSGFITNQLNQLADKYIQGVQVNFNVESYQSKYDKQSTLSQVDVGLSRQLLNNRLSINIDTGIGLESSSATNVSNTSLAHITGSFVISYNLTEDGRYRLQVFRKSDAEDPLNGGSNTSIKTGVGASYRKTFN